MNINYPLDKASVYLVACSYGPDSMALLFALQKQHKKIVVCHVNYHKRDVSDFEEESLRKYCVANNLIFEKIDAPANEKGNFQTWAREIRYDFFADVYQKFNAKGLFVAHHQDDLIETYLIQKQRKSRVKYYGIEKKTEMKEMTVIRPFLSFSKQDLRDYCHENLIPFSIDVSNFENKYLRNRIRHEVVDRLTEIERYQILQEIEERNKLLLQNKEKIIKNILGHKELSIPALLKMEKDDFNTAIIAFVSQAKKHVSLSEKQLQEIRNICLSDVPNIDISLAISLRLLKEYDVLVISEILKTEPYSFVMQKPGILDNEYFRIDFTDGAEDRNVKKSDYPLLIRTFAPKDTYKVGNYPVEVRRLFIDWKMPVRLRNSWPLILNKDGVIIYIPRYRKEFVDDHKSQFLIKVV